MKMKREMVNGVVKELGENEVLEEKIRCPVCNGQLITNYGCGMSVTYCPRCHYSDYDYFDLDFDLEG